jgi:hypothetical protein
MEPETIPGFKVLDFKEQAQARVQAELEGLSDADMVRKIRELVESGPFADWWKKAQEAQKTGQT